jgi:hypothetical protein
MQLRARCLALFVGQWGEEDDALSDSTTALGLRRLRPARGSGTSPARRRLMPTAGLCRPQEWKCWSAPVEAGRCSA